jgi:regulatory protein YycH of two-component signal transduction system YycFG
MVDFLANNLQTIMLVGMAVIAMFLCYGCWQTQYIISAPESHDCSYDSRTHYYCYETHSVKKYK